MRKLRYLLQLSSAGFKRGLQVASRSAKTFSASTKRSFTSVGRLTKKVFSATGRAISKSIKRGFRVATNSAKSFGSTIKKVLTSPLVLIGTLTASLYKLGTSAFSGARQFRDLEQEFANINTLLDKNNQLSEKAKKNILELSTKYGTDAKKNLQAYYDAVSAGIKTEKKQLAVTDTANKVAIAGKSDVATAQSALLTLMETYGVSAKKAGDFLIQTVNQGRTTLGKLAPSIGKVADLANKAGVSFDELGAIIAEGTKGGQETSEVMSALRQMFVSIIKVTPQAEEELKKLGIEGFNVAGIQAQGLTNKMTELYNATQKFKDIESVAKIFQSVEAVGVGLRAIPGLPKAKREFEEKREGATDRGFEIATNTIENRMKILDQQIDAIWRKSGKAISEFQILLKEVYVKISEMAVNVINTIHEVVKSFGKEKILGVFDAIQKKLAKFLENPKEKFKEIIEIITETANKVKEFFVGSKYQADDFSKSISNIVSGIKDFVEELKTAYGFVEKLLSPLVKLGGLIGKFLPDIDAGKLKEGTLSKDEVKKYASMGGPMRSSWTTNKQANTNSDNAINKLANKINNTGGTIKVEFKGEAKDLLQAKFEKSGQNKTLNTKSFDPTKDAFQRQLSEVRRQFQ